MCSVYLVNLILFWLYITGTKALYFPVKEYNVNLPVTSKRGERVLRVYALPKFPAQDLGIRYFISSRSSREQFFRINTDGWITVFKDILPTDYDVKEGGKTHDITVKALQRPKEATVKVKITIIKGYNTCDEMTRDMCFNAHAQFTLEENLSHKTFGSILPPDSMTKPCTDLEKVYNVIKDNHKTPRHFFGIDNSSAELVSYEGLDAETTNSSSFRINCTLKQGSKVLKWFQKQINLTVVDVGEYLPQHYSGRTTINLMYRPKKNKLNELVDITLLDKDASKSAYAVSIRQDRRHQFTVAPPYIFKRDNSWMVILKVKWNKAINMSAHHYEFLLVVKDRHYKGHGNNELVLPIRVNLMWNQVVAQPPRGQYSATVSRAASQYTKVKYLPEVNPYFVIPNPKFTITNTGEDRLVFGITPKTGLLYVKNPVRLQHRKVSNIHISIVTSIVNHTGLDINITVQDFNGTSLDQCLGCATAKDEDSCDKNCGKGSPIGRCSWRQQGDNQSYSPLYATCTPDVSTCPDGICDEVEQLDPTICPQDCTRNVDAPSLARLNKETRRGVVQCHGSCWCSGPRDHITCYCQGNYNYSYSYDDEQNMYTKDIGVVTNESGEPHHVPKMSSSVQRKEDLRFCNQSCQITVGVSAAFVGMLICALVVVKIRYQRKLAKDKVRESTRSLTAIPSNYVERQPSIAPSEDWSPTFLRHKIPFDAKWEFPRKNLILDKILGEGEFGKVVKAEALCMGGRDGYSPVAVKMLKDNATNAEFRDLLSEFNLLKDVTHPNVIKLLAACTDEGGPFFVIVEFCEFGSLRSYLREAREVESHYLEQSRVQYDISDTEDEDENTVSPRDLLSFAWQIAKGMQYLTEMKLVHRDLAARNVLVTAGKVIKISDFGLSRDVYEEDAYRKQSKGRIPVKWMAPESLYHQVYTSKSDVWSYGIILWEIVTLGATPYPGIAPERLFHLLKEGYRMQMPENCSKELYTIMLHCWHDNPLYRPCFFDLANVFDKMLQQSVEYIDLNNYDRQPICDDLEDILARIGPNDSSDEEDGDPYGSINMLPCDDDAYLTPIPRPWQDQGQCPDCGATAVFSQSGREVDYACECSLMLSQEASTSSGLRRGQSSRRSDRGSSREKYKEMEQLKMPLMACENMEYMRTTVV